MFAFLSKFLPQFILPLGLACVLLVFAIIFRRSKRWQTSLTVLALLVLYLSSNRWVAYSLARTLEWRYLPQQTTPAAEVIVVLGGGTERSQFPRQIPEVTGAGDRVIYGAYLYKQGAAPDILLSGGLVRWSGEEPTSSADDMAQLMALMDIPAEHLWIQRESANTYDDAVFSKRILAEKGIDRVILVTSAMHMPRSVALFEAQGLEVIPAPADFTVTQSGWDAMVHADFGTQVINLLPSTSSLGLTTNALREYIGMFIYTLRGWM